MLGTGAMSPKKGDLALAFPVLREPGGMVGGGGGAGPCAAVP